MAGLDFLEKRCYVEISFVTFSTGCKLILSLDGFAETNVIDLKTKLKKGNIF